MRFIHVHLLRQDGKTEWRRVPWGKRYLDDLRRQGYAIIGYSDE
jgi:hypothetical protein